VTVTALCPGPTRTALLPTRAGLTRNQKRSGRMSWTAAAVAHAGYNAMMAGKPLAVTGIRNKLRMLPIPLVPSRGAGALLERKISRGFETPH